MAETTGISWTDSTFNPWIGCTKISPGCTNCYAEADMDTRRGRVKWGPKGTRSRTSDDYWKQPLMWNRRAVDGDPHPDGRPRVFCASLADVFEDWQGPIIDHNGFQLCHRNSGGYRNEGNPTTDRACTMADLRRDLFTLIDRTPNLDWLLLTKRPENVRRMWGPQETADAYGSTPIRHNVWLGCSPCDQSTADALIPNLLQLRDLTPVLFLSMEPLLGPVDLSPYLARHHYQCWDKAAPRPALRHEYEQACDTATIGPAIQWVIIGGESGKDARPCDLAWIRSLRDQCQAAEVPVFVKQLGSQPYIDHSPEPAASIARRHSVGPLVAEFLRFRDPKGGDPSEWPEDLRVREFPALAMPQSV